MFVCFLVYWCCGSSAGRMSTSVQSKVIWQCAASPTCHPSRLRMNSSDLDSHLAHSPLDSQLPKWHLRQFSRLCTAHPCDEQTHRPRYVRHLYQWSTSVHCVHAMRPNKTVLTFPKISSSVWQMLLHLHIRGK